VPKTSKVSTRLSGPTELFIALTVIYNMRSLLELFNSNNIMLYTCYNSV
jgi:hypothetical protein